MSKDNQFRQGMQSNSSLLIVGNFLSEHLHSRGTCEDLSDHLSRAGWTIITTSNRLGKIWRLIDMVATVSIRRKDYALACIDTYSGPAFFLAEVVGFTLWLMRKPLILILHGGDLPKFAQRWPGRVIRLLKTAVAVTTPSQYLQDKMQSYRPDIDIKVIPNPIELRAYHYHTRSMATPNIIWLRAFHRIYNPSLAPRVLYELKKQGIEANLTMVGPDKGDGSREEVLQLVDELEVGSQITIINGIPKEQVPGQLSQKDIFINTTDIDNTPVSVIEAMACGMCIVSTNVGGIPYLLEDEKDALLVPPNNPGAMAKAIFRIITEPGLAARLSSNARTKAKRFDWALILPEWEQLFSEIIKNA